MARERRGLRGARRGRAALVLAATLLLGALQLPPSGAAAAVVAAPSEVEELEATAPEGLRCVGRALPGDPSEWRWEWQWQMFNVGASNAEPRGIVLDRDCNVYVADGGLSRVVKLSPIGETLAEWGSPGKDAGQFERLAGVAVDGAGNLYVADSGNSRLQKLSPTGEVLQIWTPQCRFGNPGGGARCVAFDGNFNGNLTVAVDGTGTVYTASPGQVQKFTSDGALLAKWGTPGRSPGQLNAPGGIAVDRRGDVYVADTLNHRVQKFSPTGAFLAQWGGERGTGPGQLNQPRGITVDREGNVYVADTDNSRVQKLDPSGAFLAQWVRCVGGANPCRAIGKGDGLGEFFFPAALAADGQGNLFVADTANYRVQGLIATAVAIPTTPPEAAPEAGVVAP